MIPVIIAGALLGGLAGLGANKYAKNKAEEATEYEKQQQAPRNKAIYELGKSESSAKHENLDDL
jgi:hypothetical protein